MVAILLAKSHLKIQLGSKDTIPVGFKLFLLFFTNQTPDFDDPCSGEAELYIGPCG